MEREVAYPRSERVALDEARHSVERTCPHMCAWCRRVRDEHSDWESVGAFFESRAAIRFTQGTCDGCARSNPRAEQVVQAVDGLYSRSP